MTEAWIIDAVRTPRGVGTVGKGAVRAPRSAHTAPRCAIATAACS
jgi:hypothetical protein